MMEIERKLFVGGISRETDEAILRNYFSSYGEVEHVLILLDKDTGHSKGFGFVTFTQSSMAELALAAQNHSILGRKVDVKRARPRGQREEDSSKLKQQQCGVRKIFVGGLPDSLTIAEFKAYFEGFGSVQDVVMMRDAEGRPRGFGFVTFDSEAAANAVLQTSFHELKNKRVEAKKAEPKESMIQASLHGFYGNSCFLDSYRPTLPCYDPNYGWVYSYSYGAPLFVPYISPIRVGTRSSVKVTISSPDQLNTSSNVGISVLESTCGSDKNVAHEATSAVDEGNRSIEDVSGQSCSTSDVDDEDSVDERIRTEVDGNCSNSDDANPMHDMSHKSAIDSPLKMVVVRV